MHATTDRQARSLLTTYRRTRDLTARNAVAVYLHDKWLYRARNLFCTDPMQTKEDLHQTFFMGILEGIEKDKGLGDSLYFVGQHAFWRVGSSIRASNIRRRRLVPEDPTDIGEFRIRDRTEDLAYEVINRVSAEQTAIALRPTLTGRAREAFDLLLSDQGDEIGRNKRLAESMGVSEQRASQIMATVRDELENVA